MKLYLRICRLLSLCIIVPALIVILGSVTAITEPADAATDPVAVSLFDALHTEADNAIGLYDLIRMYRASCRHACQLISLLPVRYTAADAWPDNDAPTVLAPPREAAAPEVPPDDSLTTDKAYAAAVIRLVNQERAAYGLAPLTEDMLLDQAAGVRSTEIITSFSHTRPDSSSCFTSLQQVGAFYCRAGENIALGQPTPEQVMADWLDSPGHRANIINADFRNIGVAVLKSTGPYSGYAWVQVFTD